MFYCLALIVSIMLLCCLFTIFQINYFNALQLHGGKAEPLKVQCRCFVASCQSTAVPKHAAVPNSSMPNLLCRNQKVSSPQTRHRVQTHEGPVTMELRFLESSITPSLRLKHQFLKPPW